MRVPKKRQSISKPLMLQQPADYRWLACSSDNAVLTVPYCTSINAFFTVHSALHLLLNEGVSYSPFSYMNENC